VNKFTEHGEYVYGYDDLYRLVSSDPAAGGNEEFTYDPVGNRLTSADTTEAWIYNDNNELNAHNGVTYEYDDNGNMVQKRDDGFITNYIYNVEDRLTEVRDGQGSLIASYYYDPFGRRLWKEVGGAKTYFLYADEGLIGEYDSTGTEIKTYGYKPSSTWTTDPIFMKQDGNYYFYQNDHLGTPQKMTGVNGEIVWEAKYSSFGDAEVEGSSTITNNLRFPGQYEDEETGLHYNCHRYYDPSMGRYLRPDPVGLNGGVNSFVYANLNPIIFSDFRGLDADKWTFGEIGECAITSLRNFTAPPGLADAKASINACCTRNGGDCSSKDGSTATEPGDRAAWNNIVNATGGTDRSGGGNYMCVNTQRCKIVTKCYECCGNQKRLRKRETPLQPTGTLSVGGCTLYIYDDPLKGWCTRQDYISRCRS